MVKYVFSTMPADGLGPFGAWVYGGTVMMQFVSGMDTGPALRGLNGKI